MKTELFHLKTGSYSALHLYRALHLVTLPDRAFSTYWEARDTPPSSISGNFQLNPLTPSWQYCDWCTTCIHVGLPVAYKRCCALHNITRQSPRFNQDLKHRLCGGKLYDQYIVGNISDRVNDWLEDEFLGTDALFPFGAPSYYFSEFKGAGQFDGSKNYEYFGGLVKKQVHI